MLKETDKETLVKDVDMMPAWMKTNYKTNANCLKWIYNMGKLWLNNEIVDRLAMLQQTEAGHPGVNQVAIEKTGG